MCGCTYKHFVRAFAVNLKSSTGNEGANRRKCAIEFKLDKELCIHTISCTVNLVPIVPLKMCLRFLTIYFRNSAIEAVVMIDKIVTTSSLVLIMCGNPPVAELVFRQGRPMCTLPLQVEA